MNRIFILILFTCLLSSCKTVSNNFFLENLLNENVFLQAKNADGNILSQKNIAGNDRILVLASSTRDPQSVPDIIDAVYALFDNESDIRTIDFVFADNLKYTMNLESTVDPQLDLFNYSNWDSEQVGRNESDRTYRITQAHKDAAQ